MFTPNQSPGSRRDFIKATTVAAGTAALAAASGTVHAAGTDAIRVGVIGCGGRGSGAAKNILDADPAVKVVAWGDVFEDRAKEQSEQLGSKYKGRVEAKTFGGLDNYKNVLSAGIDLVILATPPGFRPVHLEAAIQAGKHVFCEKPVAVDGPGIRKCMELVEESKKKNLAVVAGTQRRHQKAYNTVYKMIQDGLIGDIVSARCSWNGQGIWFNTRTPGMKDVEYQLANWYHFLWLCGDHIVEQHVHNLDVCNWFTGMHPKTCVGMGGRQGGHKGRPDGDPKEVGHIYDHFAVEYEYPNGVKMASYCRHIPGTRGDVSEMVVGTKGTIQTADKSYYTLLTKSGTKELYTAAQDRRDLTPYTQEHIDMLKSIRAGKPLNELQSVTESTLTAIMGRMSAYTGKDLKWEDALNSQEDTMPKSLALDMDLPAPVLPAPGKTKFV